jgi:hypothetical protein
VRRRIWSTFSVFFLNVVTDLKSVEYKWGKEASNKFERIFRNLFIIRNSLLDYHFIFGVYVSKLNHITFYAPVNRCISCPVCCELLYISLCSFNSIYLWVYNFFFPLSQSNGNIFVETKISQKMWTTFHFSDIRFSERGNKVPAFVWEKWWRKVIRQGRGGEARRR